MNTGRVGRSPAPMTPTRALTPGSPDPEGRTPRSKVSYSRCLPKTFLAQPASAVQISVESHHPVLSLWKGLSPLAQKCDRPVFRPRVPSPRTATMDLSMGPPLLMCPAVQP